MADNDSWNYYKVQYLDPTFLMLDNSNECKNFIIRYFEAGEKSTGFFRECIDKLPEKRLKHIVSSFFLGIALYKNSNRIKYYIKREIFKLPFPNKETKCQRFAYLWFLITLFHDLGYAIEDGLIKDIVKSELIFDKEKPKSIPEIYNKTNIDNYEKYRNCRWNVKDHGIFGGNIFYARMCELRSEKLELNSPFYWGVEMEDIYHYAAWTIMCHNIYFIKTEDSNWKCYLDYKLKDFVNPSKREITLVENPILFLFSIIDTIEPIKTSHISSKFSKTDVIFNNDSIEFKFNSLCESLLSAWKSKIFSLNEWLTDVTINKIKTRVQLNLGENKISFKPYLSRYNLPIVHIKPKNQLSDADIFYPFAIDTSIKHNLIHSCLLKDFKNLDGITYEQMLTANKLYWQIAKAKNNFFHHESPVYLTFGFYEKVGEKKVKCKDGIKRMTEEIKFNFFIDGDEYNEIFYVDEGMCNYTRGRSQVHGILGLNFLKKHKWVIDFQKQSVIINSPPNE